MNHLGKFAVTSLLLALSLNCAAATKEQHIAVKFDAVVGDQNFACGKSYDGIGITKSRITPSDFRFFISGVELLDAKGNAVPLTLDQDGIWQYKNLALLDFENGSGSCRNGNVGLHTAVTGSVPKGKYRGVRFTLGVPFELNHGDPTIAPSPLNFTGMFWVWQSGYKFAKIDMASNGLTQAADAPSEMSFKNKLAAMEKFAAASGVSGKRPPRAAGFSVHLGSTVCVSPTLTTPPSECKNPNRLTVTFDKFDSGKNVVVADLASLLQGANVDVNAPDTAPGCMSATDDADCLPVMSAFGLPYNDQPVVPQRFFMVR
jgi:uncharacterized repeat protein (TIGR04052 family)